jgi:hypothetical protein
LRSLFPLTIAQRLRSIGEVLGEFRVGGSHPGGLLLKLFGKLLALLFGHRFQAASKVLKVLRCPVQVSILRRLATGKAFHLPRHLLKRGAAGVGLGVKPLLETCLGRGKVCKRFFAVAGVAA